MADQTLVDAYLKILRSGYGAAAGESVTDEHEARGLESLERSADRLALQLEHSILDAPWARGEILQVVHDWLNQPGDLNLADLREALPFTPSRALMIARTETAGVWNAAHAAGLRAHGWTSVVWIAGDDACEDCAALDGQVMSMAEYDENVMPHPNCSCSCEANAEEAADEDEGDEVEDAEA